MKSDDDDFRSGGPGSRGGAVALPPRDGTVPDS